MLEPRKALAMQLLPFSDTVRMPWHARNGSGERVVPPALAILFRLAVGPAADYYVPRFLRFEKAGHAIPGWHWPALWFPSAWAFYRRLWVPGILAALPPISGAAAFAVLQPVMDEAALVWLIAAAAALWLLPGVLAALFANSLLYRRVKRLLRRAQAHSTEMTAVARQLSTRRPTALLVALLVGGAVVALAPSFIAPRLYMIYHDRDIQGRVAASLAAVKPLQLQVEESLQRFHALPHALDRAVMIMQRSGTLIDSVSFNPLNGRLRLALASTEADSAGDALLLTPVLDAWGGLYWVCIPVHIAQKYLPKECRRAEAR
jgi:hypothetical protein